MTTHRRGAAIAGILVVALLAGVGLAALPGARVQAAAIVALFVVWGAYEIPKTYRARAVSWGLTEAARAARYQLAALCVLIATGVALALLDPSDGVAVAILVPAIVVSAAIEAVGDAAWHRYLDRERVLEVMPTTPGASMTTTELQEATGLGRRRLYRATTDLYFAGVITLPVGHTGYQLVDVKE